MSSRACLILVMALFLGATALAAALSFCGVRVELNSGFEPVYADTAMPELLEKNAPIVEFVAALDRDPHIISAECIYYGEGLELLDGDLRLEPVMAPVLRAKRIDVAALMVERGADPLHSPRGGNGRKLECPLVTAAWDNQSDIVERMLDHVPLDRWSRGRLRKLSDHASNHGPPGLNEAIAQRLAEAAE